MSRRDYRPQSGCGGRRPEPLYGTTANNIKPEGVTEQTPMPLSPRRGCRPHQRNKQGLHPCLWSVRPFRASVPTPAPPLQGRGAAAHHSAPAPPRKDFPCASLSADAAPLPSRLRLSESRAMLASALPSVSRLDRRSRGGAGGGVCIFPPAPQDGEAVHTQ